MADETLAAILAEIKMNAGKFYVYVLSYPSGGLPFYVGCGTARQNHNRILDHEKVAFGPSKNRKSLKSSIIRKIVRDGGAVCRAIDSWHLSTDAMFAREVELIDAIGRRDLGLGPLTNGNDGGTGQFNPSIKTKGKMVAAHKRRWTEDARMVSRERVAQIFHTPAAKLKQKTACTSPEFRAKRSAAQKAAMQDPVYKKRMLAGLTAALERPEYREMLSKLRKAQASGETARKLASEKQKMVWKDPAYREKAEANCRAMALARWSKPGARERLSAKMKAFYSPERRAERAEAIVAASTSKEKSNQ